MIITVSSANSLAPSRKIKSFLDSHDSDMNIVLAYIS